MKCIVLSEPEWLGTFPLLVKPFPDEWLPGFLLRCDETNHWPSGTTTAYLFFRLSTRNPYHHFLIPPPGLLEELAEILAIPLQVLFATTYLPELTRIYHLPKLPSPMILNASFSFRVCPACVKNRVLKRMLTLAHLPFCPLHQVMLCQHCPCGTPQQLFCRQSQPFTCRQCGLDWAQFPRIIASPETVWLGNRILAWYNLFFSNGTPALLASTLRLIHHAFSEQRPSGVRLFNGKVRFVPPDLRGSISLGYIVNWLVSLDLSPEELTTESGITHPLLLDP